MSNSTKFRIRKSHNREYYWTLQATNGEIILTSSETYKTKQACKKGIASCKKNTTDTSIHRLKSSNGQFFFRQVARNRRQLGRSELYTSKRNCEKGIASVKQNAPKATVADETI